MLWKQMISWWWISDIMWSSSQIHPKGWVHVFKSGNPARGSISNSGLGCLCSYDNELEKRQRASVWSANTALPAPPSGARICSSWRTAAQAYTLPTASCVFSGHRLHLSAIMTGVPPTSCTHTAIMSCNHISGPLVELGVWVGLPPLPHSDCCPPSISCTARLMRSRRPTYQRSSDACLKGLIKTCTSLNLSFSIITTCLLFTAVPCVNTIKNNMGWKPAK